MVGAMVFIFMAFMVQDIVAVYSICNAGKFDNLKNLYDFSGKNLTQIPEGMPNVCRFLLIERLNFSGNTISEVSVYGFSGLTKLVTLDLSINNISNLTSDVFSNLLSLENLSMAKNGLVEIDEMLFNSLHNLTSLDISENKIVFIKESTFQTQSKLQWLSLSNNRLRYIPIKLFENLGRLNFLDLSGNNLATISPKTFEGCKKLHNLTVAINMLSEIQVETFLGLKWLNFLNLSYNKITEVGLDAFQCFIEEETDQNVSAEILTGGNNEDKVCNLKYVDLSRNKLKTFNLREYFPVNADKTDFNKFRNLSLILSYNNLKSIDNASLTWINQTKTFPEVTGNPWNCSCSNLYHAFEILREFPPLYCEYPRVVNGKTWTVLEEDLRCNEPEESRTIRDWDSAETEDFDVENITSQIGSDDAGVENYFLQTNVIVLGIYACTVIAAIIIILVITHYIGEPEDEEFWWEDKLAKRSY